MRKKLIVVLGMHRGGTSVITRSLQVMGVDLGDKFLPPQEDNITGFWEDLDIYTFNLEILDSLNSDWHVLTPIQAIDVVRLRERGYIQRGVDLLLKKTSGEKVFGFKDPRVAKLLPFWKEVFSKGQLNVSYVLAIRHPISVCKSLEKRNGFDFEKSSLIWLEHIISSLAGTMGKNCIVVDYDRLLISPDTELEKVAKKLDLQITPSELIKFKTEFLDKKLRHTVYQLNDLIQNNSILTLIKEVYSTLLDIASNKLQFDDTALKKLITQWSNEYFRLKPVLVFATKLDSRITEYNTQVADLNTQVADLNTQVADQRQIAQSLNATLHEIYNSRGWKVLQKILALRLAIIPRNSLRESFFRFLLKPRWANPKGFARRALLRIRTLFLRQPTLRRMVSALISPQMRAKLNRIVQSSDSAISASGTHLSSKTPMDWEDYLRLSQSIKTARQAKLAAFTPKQPSMINLEGKNLFEIARSLTFKQQEKPEVSIVIPVHNHGRLTLECLTSINQHTNSTSYQVVLVDDGSNEEMANLLRTISNISLIRNHERIGFTQSCNKGAAAASGKYLVFLNNDTQVVSGWLEYLLNTYGGHSCVGTVGPKVIYPDGRLQEAGALINQDGTATLIGLADDPDLPRYNYDREIDYCSGVCLLVEANTFRNIGGFDEVYAPAYYEDVDLCLKLRKRGKKNLYCSKATIIHHLSATSQEIDSGFKLGLVSRNRQLLLERWQGAIDELNLVKLIAFYLPQYHPIPENDLWWGKGFTEWANVTRAQPNYEGHYQPHLPADLGFYDLRISAVMEQQVELAKRYGIHGFCFYYYWFDSKRILEMPLERMLETGKPDFPFCLCWANENWSRRWDGSEDHVLLAQKHSDEDDRAVILDMTRYISHPNYIRLDGKPIILIYRISLFPNIKRTAQIWREVCRENNIGEIHLVMIESFEKSLKIYDPHEFGLDAAIEFPPHNMATAINAAKTIINPHFSGLIMNYADEALKYVTKDIPGHVHYKNVMPSWDNTARKQNTSFIFNQANPGAYQAWLEAALQQTREQLSGDHRILFLNAWNEWAEGNHLEPDQRYGHRYLEATLNAQERSLIERAH